MSDKVKQKGAYFTATNLKTANDGLPVYKKNGVSTYYKKLASGELAAVVLNTSVKNASGAVMKLAAYKKKTATPKAPKPAAPKPAPVAGPKTPPGYTKTNLKMESASGKLALNVFKKNSNGTYHARVGASLIDLFPDIVLTKPNGSKVKVGDLAKATGPKTPPGYTKTNLQYKNIDIYKKNSNGTYWHKKYNGTLVTLPVEYEVTKPDGSQVQLKSLISPKPPSGYTVTNLKYGSNNVGFKKIYEKNGKYYTKLLSGTMVNLPNYTQLTKPNGSKVKISNLKSGAGPSAPPAAKTPPGYTKTNMKWPTPHGNKNIYLKNHKYYTKLPISGFMTELLSTTVLTKPNGSKVKVANLKSGAPAAAKSNGYTKTNLKLKHAPGSSNGVIYKKNSNGTFYFKSTLLGAPTMIEVSPYYTIIKPNGKEVFAAEEYPDQVLTEWKNSGHKSGNGKKVYKHMKTGELMVLKNGKISTTFIGKKALKALLGAGPSAPPKAKAPAKAKTPNMASGSGIAPVVTTSLVPVFKPGPDHIKAAETAYANAVKKVADKLKELQEATGGNNSKNFENYKAATGVMGFVHMNRANTVTYKATTVKGFHGAMGWRSSLDKPKFTFFTRQVKIKYTQYLAHQQLLFLYGKNVNSFENVRMSDIIDTKWLVAQDKYIRSLSSRQLFTMYGYSFKGDSWAHSHLGNYFDINRFKTDLSSLGHQYFAFFFQARDFYKINSGKIDNDYNLTLDRVKTETDVNNLKAIMNIFINELNEIIRNAPAVTRTFIVFRGQADDKYLTGVTGNLYTTERFCSTSVDGDVSREQFSHGHTLQRITLLKGSKCLLMFGSTKFANELEILLPRGSTYQIVKKRTNVVSDPSTNFIHPSVNPKKVKNLVDIVLIGSVEKAPPVEAVPVTVIPQTNVQIMQNIVEKLPGWSLMKVTGLLGKGGYGAVYQASDPNFDNLAIKIQKKSNNSNAEVKALKKLRAAKMAPTYINNNNIKATNNIKKLVPRNLEVGNNVSVLASQMIRGSPLKKWYTGAPIPQNIKNKLANSISKMHNNGVIHGNLHRNNIIIGNNGKAYVIDFGKSLVTNKSFKTLNEANNYLKKLTGKTKVSHSKTSWYSNNKRTHFLDGNFMRRLK
jgi:predicted Ser/Thr protein kinase